MSRTNDILEKTKRKEPEAKKWKVVVGIVVGLFVGCLLFCGIWGYVVDPFIDEYLQNKKDVVAIYDFLELNVGEEETAVYFIGSSLIGHAIDSEEINRLLNERGSNVTVYNLGLSASSARQRSILNQNIIDSKPSLVVIGGTYRYTLYNDINYERIITVRDDLKISSDSYYLFTSEELAEINKPYTYFDDKRFVFNALSSYILDGDSRINLRSTTDIYTITKETDWRVKDEFRYSEIDVGMSLGWWAPVITDEITQAREAIIYNVNTFKDAGIPVVIINMPLHPLVSEHITDESRENYFEFLDSTGAIWYDYEFACQDDKYWYWEGAHIAPETGAKMFAPQMAELIIELEESNVIHHS